MLFVGLAMLPAMLPSASSQVAANDSTGLAITSLLGALAPVLGLLPLLAGAAVVIAFYQR